jgi:hypothetical protein
MIEEESPKPAGGFTPPPLDAWGVAELRRYIATLQASRGGGVNPPAGFGLSSSIIRLILPSHGL